MLCVILRGVAVVAVDIELSGSSRLPLQLGVVEVEGGRVRDRHRIWLRVVGHPFRWLSLRARIDDSLRRSPALTEDVYGRAPYIVDAWPEIEAIAAGRPLVLHNAGLDIAAIRAGFDAHGAAWPQVHFGCTLALARRVWPELARRHRHSRGMGPPGGYRIDQLAAALFPTARLFAGTYVACGHDPVEDAEAAARVVIAAAEHTGASTTTDLATATGWPIRALQPDRCQTSSGWVERQTRRPSPPLSTVFDRATERAAYLEIREQWRGDRTDAALGDSRSTTTPPHGIPSGSARTSATLGIASGTARVGGEGDGTAMGQRAAHAGAVRAPGRDQ